jgi:hypothetical protein
MRVTTRADPVRTGADPVRTGKLTTWPITYCESPWLQPPSFCTHFLGFVLSLLNVLCFNVGKRKNHVFCVNVVIGIGKRENE